MMDKRWLILLIPLVAGLLAARRRTNPDIAKPSPSVTSVLEEIRRINEGS